MSDLQAIDQRYIWHPFTQQQTARKPLVIQKARGAYLETDDGRQLIDAIASWWVNLHGHCHPYIMAKLKAQCDVLEQVIFAGATHPGAISLASRLVGLLPAKLSRIFYSDNGSTAVEVAIKMAVQYWHNQGKPRSKILALRHAYHGDTLGAMSVSERGPFTAAFAPLMHDGVLFIDPPLHGGNREELLTALTDLLQENGGDIAAFIYEPLVQGAAGMLMQDADTLSAMLTLIQEAGILCIADEVMTGFGRTGHLFASDALSPKPDLMCLAKGLTGGTLPLSVTACSEAVYAAFLSDDRSKAFFHGHSFTANALGCAAALASLDLLAGNECLAAIEMIIISHAAFRNKLTTDAAGTVFKDVRQQGTILAMNVETGEASGYFNRIGEAISAFFLDEGILVRPLGNVLYVIPPYCISQEDLERIYAAILKFGRLLGEGRL